MNGSVKKRCPKCAKDLYNYITIDSDTGRSQFNSICIRKGCKDIISKPFTGFAEIDIFEKHDMLSTKIRELQGSLQKAYMDRRANESKSTIEKKMIIEKDIGVLLKERDNYRTQMRLNM